MVEHWNFPEAKSGYSEMAPVFQVSHCHRVLPEIVQNKKNMFDMKSSNLSRFQEFFFLQNMFKSMNDFLCSNPPKRYQWQLEPASPLTSTPEHPTCFVETASAAAFAASAAFAGFAASAACFAVYFAAAIAGSIAGSAASSTSSSETTAAYAVATAAPAQSGALLWALAQQADC